MQLFSVKEEKELLKIFKIFAPSKNTAKMQDYIISKLNGLKIPYVHDEHGNIYNLSNNGKPLLSAHMDSVGDHDDGFLNYFVNIYDYYDDRIIKGMGNIGGDDKCGIFLAIKVLSEIPDLNFIFSIDEEVGCVGIKQVITNDTKLSNIPYGLILDRRGCGDIICVNNNYGTKEFQDELSKVGKEFNYIPATGSCSDANTISDYISCANLSVGYHNPHSKNEFISLNDMYNTYNYIMSIIPGLEGKTFYKPVKTPAYKDSGKGFTTYCYGCKKMVPSKDMVTGKYGSRICSTCKELETPDPYYDGDDYYRNYGRY